LDGNVGDVKAGRSHAGRGFGEKGCAGGIGPPRIGRPVVAAKVTEAGGTQQCITCCVGDDVTIGVTNWADIVIEA
jgi:hypothetical protein